MHHIKVDKNLSVLKLLNPFSSLVHGQEPGEPLEAFQDTKEHWTQRKDTQSLANLS